MHTVATLLPRVFLPFAAGYFLSFLYRAVNAVIAPELLRDLSLDPGSLGLLTATYFIAFASFQLPLGVLLDRYGPRRVEALLLLFAAAGAFCFARAHSLPLLIAGRALIGFGVSACLMAAGGLGALAAASPVQALLAWTDWRGIFLGLALVTLAVAALLFLVVPRTRWPMARPNRSRPSCRAFARYSPARASGGLPR
jgi:MFS family permease